MKMAGKSKKIEIVIFLLLFLVLTASIPLPGYSEKLVKIYSSVDEDQIGINDTLSLTVTIEAKNISKILEPIMPDVSPFKIIDKSSSTSTEISFINGKTSRVKKYIYRYTLKPEKIGKFIIGAVSVRYKDKQFKTEPIEITVTEKSKNDRGYITDEGIKINPEKIKKEIFIKNTCNKKNVYTGEQIYLTYEIFSSHEIERISLTSMPEMKGFYRIDIGNLTKLKYTTLLMNGKSYKKAVLKKIVLFPLFPGEFKIAPMRIKVTALIRNPEFPNFFALPYTLAISSPELSIKVNPLPAYRGKGRFSGVVGDLTLNISQYSKTIYFGESSKFYITLKSTGNLNNIKNFQFSPSKACKIILSDIYTDKNPRNGVYYFSKKFEYTVIPEKTGNLLIKSKGVTYFDTKHKRYIYKDIKPIVFNVKNAISSNGGSPNNETNKELSTKKEVSSKYKILIFSLISAFLILTAILSYLLIRARKNQSSINNKHAEQNSEPDEISRNIRLLIAEAESRFLNNNITKAASLLKKALTATLSSTINTASGNITVNSIIRSDLDDGIKNEIKAVLDLLNKIIYSPKKEQSIHDIEQFESYIDRVKILINRLKDILL